MDWNKTKTIFIVVFSILNIFLYSMYVDQRTEALNVPLIGQTSVEDLLKADNISFMPPQNAKTHAGYISAKFVSFTKEQLEELKDQTIVLTEDNTKIQSKLKKPVVLSDPLKKEQFTEFLETYVYAGKEYVLWKVDEEERVAFFFQQAGDEPIYYSQNAMLVVHWDEDGEITYYTQKMLRDFSGTEEKELLTPFEAVGSLVTRTYLKPDSKVKSITLGYSTLVQLTDTQVFAPTWNIHVELKDGDTEDYFINAIEGKVVEFHMDPEEDEAEEE